MCVAEAHSVSAACNLLRTDGATVLASASGGTSLNGAEVAHFVSLIAEGRALSRACRTTPTKPGTELGGLGFRELVPGRWHANLMQRPSMAAVFAGGGAGAAGTANSASLEAQLEDWHDRARTRMESLIPRFMPLVKQFFEPQPILEKECSERVVLSQLQLLDIEPGAVAQMWHADNVRHGLTVIIPLVGVNSELLGPTEIILGSHTLVARLWAARDVAAGSSGSKFAPPPLPLRTDVCTAHAYAPEGRALAFDSRVLHRGMPIHEMCAASESESNVTGNGSGVQLRRPALVLRWDAVATPPPGTGLLGTAILRIVATVLATAESVVR